ncbi:MAG: glycosyltransferase family 4 protein, partial [Candidatus Diapherotrites archaeon]|nr:glycosyltransferase family 4 protein [Candidatus Diapherotrites archaeon]
MYESKKLRIVYITKNFPPLPRISGTQKYATYLCTELNKISDLTVIALDNLPRGHKCKQAEFKTIRAGQPFAVKAALAAKKQQPDVVVFGSGLSSSFWLAPTLFFMRLALGSTPFVLHQLTEFNGKAMPGLLRAGSRFVDKIVCTNNSLYKYFSKPAGNKAVLLLPGLDLSQFPVRENKNGKKIRIGFFGHFHYVKGPDRLLHAFKQLRLPNAELVFSGIDYEDGAMHQKLLQQSKLLNGIAFLGTSKNYLQLLNSCDFVVLPFRASGSVLGVSMAAI